MDATPLRLIFGLLLFDCTSTHYIAGDARDRKNSYGTHIGTFKSSSNDTKGSGHGIKGELYGVDESTLFIKGFSYDGTAADAYFLVGNGTSPGPHGYTIPYPPVESGSDPEKLGAYNNADVLLELPAGKKLRDMSWLSVWCKRFAMSLDIVNIPRNLTVPKARMLSEFSRLNHGLRSGNISILDSKTIYIPNLHYDGAGEDTHFWVGNGTEPNPFGIKVPNEVLSLESLKNYFGQDIEIVLPRNLTVYDIEWLSVWSNELKESFGHVMIPRDLDVPTALGQTKITPHWWYNPTSSTPPPPPPPLPKELTNCKQMLDGRIQVQWEIVGDDIQMRVSGRIREDQYIMFGLSGSDGKSELIGGDVVVVAYDKKTGEFIAEDYYISRYSQCDGRQGVCPDERLGGRNDAVYLHGERSNGVTTVTYTRPLSTNEPERDKMIPGYETNVIAAIGPLNTRGEATAHESIDKTTENIRIDFTSKNVHKCTNSLYNLPDMPDDKSWPLLVITNETTFNARIGPTGGKKGYSMITGQPSGDVSWYINDLLVPKLIVERGQTYTFIVEGGNDTTNMERYHPFYITSSRKGGYGKKSEEDRADEKVYAGVRFDADGYPEPTAAGRLCKWVHKTVDTSSDMDTFKDFFETLRLECDQGEPGELVWTVEEDTPDEVFYQCYSHDYMGWKINVVGGACTALPTLTMVVSLVLGLLNLFR
ncbi:protein Skeletor, isoforms B/C isoform X1 [Lasioglossum baleicum]|uniref:protein Skeletor, isoforms B/C isoform X1 n=1 Tax=Lasioglossum baleicum TaxID=434251 RepID=UPI003FCC95AA